MFVEHLATGIAHGCSLYGGNGGIDGGNWYFDRKLWNTGAVFIGCLIEIFYQ